MTKKTNYQPAELLASLHPLASQLTPRQKDDLLANCSIMEVKRGASIYGEGETVSCLYCLLAGAVKIYMTGEKGRGQIVRLVKPLDLFGFRTMFSTDKYTTSCVALKDAVVCAIPVNRIYAYMKSNTALADFFLRLLSFDVIDSDARYVRFSQKHLRGRLAETLLYLAHYFGLKDDGQTLSVDLSREDLANFSFMTTANAIRTLSAFASEKLVELKQREIKLLDIEQIRFVREHS